MKADLIFDFLKKLAANNNREWFKAHRETYDAVVSEVEALASILIARISFFEPAVMRLEPKDCMYRIYRDIRYSKDKSPYKNHIGIFVNPKGKKSLHCGYYLHFEPGNCMIAGGGWCPTTEMLRALRQSIVDNIDEFKDIVTDPTFRDNFPTIGMERLKTAPKGFPKDFPYMEYLQPKDYIIWRSVPDSFFSEPDFIDQTVKAFEAMKPYHDFLNYTIDEFI